MGPVMKQKPTSDEMLEIVDKLRNKFKVPITAGTAFGPTGIKVTKRAKDDFHVLLGHIAMFWKRTAAAKLKDAGITVESVNAPANGKHAEDADYVEIVVPVLGEEQIPPDKTFCWSCLRYSPGGSFRPVLLKKTVPAGRPFFKTIQGGRIIFSQSFIELTKDLRLTGFVEGKTLLPVPVVN